MPPGYSGLSPLMPPSGGLSSTLTGAFQPKVRQILTKYLELFKGIHTYSQYYKK